MISRPLTFRRGLTLLALALSFATASFVVDAADGPQAPATQQPAAPPAAIKTDALQAQIDGLKVEIEQIAAGLKRQGLSDRTLAELRGRATTVKAKVEALIAEQTPALDAANARLKQLGPAPQVKDDEPAPVESDAVRNERDNQTKAAAQVEGIVKQAQLIALEADEVIKTVGDRRRARFTDTLTERTRSVLDPNLWLESAAALPRALTAFRYLWGDWISLLLTRGGDVALSLLTLFTAVLLVVFLPLRRQLFRLVERNATTEQPTHLRKTAAAAGIVAINVSGPVIVLLGLYFTLQGLDLGRDRTDQAILALTESVALANAIYSLALAILAPAKPQWRLIALGDSQAGALRRLFIVLAVSAGLGTYLTRMLDILSTSISLIIGAAGIFALVETVLMMLILRTVARTFVKEEQAEEVASTSDTHQSSILWRWIVPLAWIAAIACLGAALFGYVALARFMAHQMIWFGVVLASLYITLQVIDEAVTLTFRSGTTVGNSLIRSMGFSRETVEQIGVVLSGLARLLSICIAVYFILLPWGVNSSDVLTNARNAFFGFKIGSFTFSPSTVLMGLAAFMIGIAITRGVQGWLDQRFLPRTRLDAGLKNSIRTSLGYMGYVTAAVVAFSAVGIGLENVALVAGALSVGIGFGLQSIVNNFVSGLILLAERPIKAGDLVEIGTEKGFVRKINVRSTEIETFDRASLIVPNSTLISGLVKNWMHRDNTGRCVINVAVAYDSDPEKVRDILVATAKAHRLPMTFPAPAAFLTNFGDKALEFRLICSVANVNDAFGVESDLRYAVLKRLKEAGIEMPAAQRDLSVRQLDTFNALVAERFQRRDQKPPAGTDAPEKPAEA